jgi:hypothetical protein
MIMKSDEGSVRSNRIKFVPVRNQAPRLEVVWNGGG